MTTKQGFWDIGPHDPLPVESFWRDFVRSVGGAVVEELIPQPRTFENADFLFQGAGIAAELKLIDSEFSNSKAFIAGFDSLMQRVVTEDPAWKPLLFGGSGGYPSWFHNEYVRLFRPPVSRILKKANRQLRDTKKHFGFKEPTGVLFLVNDGFASISPHIMRGLCSQLLLHSFSSIDCCVLLTVNRYIELIGSDVPRLLWAPAYSDRAPDSLVTFIDELGGMWFHYLEAKIGPFTEGDVVENRPSVLVGSRSLVLPGDVRG